MGDSDQTVPFDDADFDQDAGLVGADEHGHRVVLHEVPDRETERMEIAASETPCRWALSRRIGSDSSSQVYLPQANLPDVRCEPCRREESGALSGGAESAPRLEPQESQPSVAAS